MEIALSLRLHWIDNLKVEAGALALLSAAGSGAGVPVGTSKGMVVTEPRLCAKHQRLMYTTSAKLRAEVVRNGAINGVNALLAAVVGLSYLSGSGSP